jgi:ribosomal protein S18 acetylase RimI-like enzyme
MVKRELVEIRRAKEAAVEGLLEEEVAEWSTRLGWQRSRLLAQLRPLLRRRRLAGWLLLLDGMPAGKVLVGEQGGVCSLEMAYLSPAWRGLGHLAWLLGRASGELVLGDPGQRLEAGLFPFSREDPGTLLRLAGFQEMWRDYMVTEMPAAIPVAGHPLTPWPDELGEPASLLLQAYRGGADAECSAFYTTQSGCRAYLKALLDGAECGGFSQPLSRVHRDGTGALAGLVLGTVLSPGVAHLAQIAVRPDLRGAGLGSSLVAGFMEAASRQGFSRLSLIASRGNAAAYAWYQRLGYRPSEPYVCYWRPGFPAR